MLVNLSNVKARSILDIRPGDHLCLTYKSDIEQQKVMVQFVASGLQRSERVLYFAHDDGASSNILQSLADYGIDVQRYLARNQLRVATSREGYHPAGRFDPDETIAMWKHAVVDALKDGFSALRAAGNATWATGNIPGAHLLQEYERRVQSEIFDLYPITAVCEFDLRCFSPDWLEAIAALHPSGFVTE